MKIPCGKCGTCIERTEAFLDNNIKDPLYNNKQWREAVKIYKKNIKK
jgi:7-cyano-7-deazaguanine synthase